MSSPDRPFDHRLSGLVLMTDHLLRLDTRAVWLDGGEGSTHDRFLAGVLEMA
jgi:hypothetical protein